MFDTERIEISCPECQAKQATQVWGSLSPSVDPESKELLFAGRVNLFSCDRCSYEAYIPIDFIYHDPMQNYCVQFYSPRSVENPNFINAFTLDGLPIWIEALGAMGKEAPYLLRPHIVFDMKELIRYVEFRDRLAANHSEAREKNAAA